MMTNQSIDSSEIEQFLEENEAIWREMFNLTGVGIKQVDFRSRRFLRVNSTFCNFTGYTKNELLTMTVDDLIHPDDREADRKKWDNLVNQGNYQSEKRYLHKDGSTIWALATGNMIRDNQGQPLYVWLVVQNISQYKQTEAALQLSEEQRRLALDLTETASWDWNLKTGEVVWSDNMFTIMGLSPSEVSPTYEMWRNCVHPEDLEKLEGQVSVSLQNHQIYDQEYRVIHPDGSLHWLQSKGSGIYDETGQPVRMVGITLDISDRKQLELDLQASKTNLSRILNSAIAAIGEFCAYPDYTYQNGFMSAGCETVYGYTQEEFKADSNLWFSRIVPEDRETIIIPAYQQIFQEETFAIEYRFQDKTDDIRWISETLMSQWDESLSCWKVTTVATNITDRKEAQDALSQSQQEYHQTLDSITDLIFVKQSDSRLVWANKAFRDYYGLSLEALVGIIDAPFNNPNYTQQYLEDDAKVFATGQVLNIPEECVTRHDGEVKLFNTIKTPIYDENGQVIMLVGVCRDITERKQIELKLEQQIRKEHLLAEITQAIYQTLDIRQILQTGVNLIREFLETDRIIIFQFQPDWSGKVVAEATNERCRPILGLEINDPCFAEKYAESYRQGRFSAINDFDNANVVAPCHKDFMAQFEVKANLVVPILQQEQLWGLLIAHHCTAPRQWKAENISLLTQLATQLGIALQQAELYQKNAQQAALIDIASDGIFVRDLDNRILFWSQGAERLYGWQKEEVIGKMAADLFEQEWNSTLETALQTTLELGTWIGELKHTTKQNQEIIVQSRWTLMQKSDSSSILVVNTDITEKKLLEKQLLHSQRLESIGTLASGIAHDLNNLFTPLLSISQILPLKNPNLDETSLKLLDILRTNTQRAADIVKQLRLFSSPGEPKSRMISLSDLLEEILKLLSETFPKNVTIESTISPNLGLIQGDATQIHQVLMNLCVNARDAMPNGGKLQITAENREIDPQYSATNLMVNVGRYVVITIADTGEGIAPDIIDRIFDPFFTTKPVGKGTGLGLSTAMSIIKNHGGIIEVESDRRQKKGSQFKIYLPATESKNLLQTPTKQTSYSGKGELILVVDDEDAIRETTKTTLENANYRVITAEDGIEAITIYAQQFQSIEMVLIDLIMPEMDGLMTMRALKKINPKVKLIASSGLDTPDRVKAAEAIKIKGFLTKPYTGETLLSIMAEGLSL